MTMHARLHTAALASRPVSQRPAAEPDRQLIDAVRAALRAVADPARAEPMRTYLKSELPMLGVQQPERRAALRPLLAGDPLPDPARWRATVRALWREAAYREERYAALALAGHPRCRAHLLGEVAASVDLLDELVVTGAWWDLVDETATRLFGPLLRAHPEPVAAVARTWAVDPDRWRRRAAVICQVGAKAGTDTALLSDVIEATAADPDFFLARASVGRCGRTRRPTRSGSAGSSPGTGSARCPAGRR